MLVTVFTPTYNRSHLLERLYQSLCSQTDMDFEWVVVDDGSIDNTQQRVLEYINQKRITIKYLKQENSGKHIAINNGVYLASGELFFIVDSDDYLLPDAIRNIKINYEKANSKDIAGLSFRKGYDENTAIGSSNFQDSHISSVFDFRYKKKIEGDMAEVVRTDILKKYPFPKIGNEKFLTEGLIWNRIGVCYKFLWLPDIIYIAEYLDGGLTSSSFLIRKNSPEGATLFYKELQSMPISLFYKIRANINYWRFAKFSNKSFFSKFKKVNAFYSLLGLPLSLIFILKDK